MFHLWLTTFNNAEWEKLKNFFNQATVWIDGSIDRQSFNSLREREKDKYVYYTDDIKRFVEREREKRRQRNKMTQQLFRQMTF